MSDTTNKTKADRRSFLKLAGVSAVGVAATGGAAVAAPPAPEKPADAMYQETAHVKRYYELAR